jgi:hypothetical protein
MSHGFQNQADALSGPLLKFPPPEGDPSKAAAAAYALNPRTPSNCPSTHHYQNEASHCRYLWLGKGIEESARVAANNCREKETQKMISSQPWFALLLLGAPHCDCALHRNVRGTMIMQLSLSHPSHHQIQQGKEKSPWLQLI